MYTAEQAKEKIESESFRFEEYIDNYLQENFQGKELLVPVNDWSESIIWGVLDKYKNHGWNVRPQNFNTGPGTGCVYFSLQLTSQTTKKS